VLWGAASKLFGLLYPLDYKDQQRIKVLGEAYRCPYKVPNDYSVGHMALGFGFHDFPPEIQKKVIGKDIIDGGGLSGDSAMLFTEYDPKKVYTFEANPDSIPGMEKVLSENAEALGDRKDKIDIVPVALGRSRGTLTLFSRFEFDGAATILPCDYETKAYEVPMISIDEFVEKHALDVGLIKLDIEGAEWDTLLGARTTIQKQKPLLLISIYHTFRDFFEIKPLLESWGLGYKFAIRDHYSSFPDAEIMLVAYCEE
jgi:FkbM family methyltransferase